MTELRLGRSKELLRMAEPEFYPNALCSTLIFSSFSLLPFFPPHGIVQAFIELLPYVSHTYFCPSRMDPETYCLLITHLLGMHQP